MLVDEFWFAPDAPARLPRPGVRLPGKRLAAGGMATLLVMLTAGFFVLRSGEQVEAQVYRYAFAAGDVRNYEMSVGIKVEPTGIPDAEPFEGKMRATMGLKVLNQLEDGSAILELSMAGLTFEPPIGAPVNPGTLKLGVTPDGRVTSVQGSGGLFGAAGGAMGSLPSFGSASDGSSNQFLFPQFPTTGVKPGDEWNQAGMRGTFEGLEGTDFGEAAKIRHQGSMPIDLSTSLAELGGGAMQMTGNISMDATSLVLRGTGDVVSMVGKITSSLQMTMPGQSLSLSMNMDMDIDIRRV